jgi:hypothetical protein
MQDLLLRKEFEMRLEAAGLACKNRAIEWVCAAMMLSFAITVMLTPSTIEVGAFRYLLAIGITPTLFMLSMFLVGFVRVGALYFNGWGLPWSARFRALCAIFGAVTFGHLGLSLAWLTRDTGAISLGVGTHVVLAITELYSVLRAGADVNESYHRRLSTGAP